MRELVTWPLKEAASVPDVQDLQPSLQAVYEAMWELKSHEIIENEYIMEILKARLQARQVNKAHFSLNCIVDKIQAFLICDDIINRFCLLSNYIYHTLGSTVTF